jgi:hypothetical protein
VHWLAPVFLIGAELTFLFFFRQVNLDEGWYLWASKLVYEGRALYRDFAYTQTPVLPYVYGLWQQIVGEGLYQGRVLTLLFTLATVGLSAASVEKIAGPMAAFFCLLLVASSFFALAQFSYTATYALTALLIAAAIYCSQLDWSDLRRNSLCGLLLVSAVGVRLSVAVAVAPFFLYLLVTSRRRFSALFWLLLSVLLWSTLIFGIYWLVSGELMVYDIAGFHTDRLLKAEWHLLRIQDVARKTFGDFGVLLGLGVVGLLWSLMELWPLRRARSRKWSNQATLLVLTVFLMTGALFAVHFLPRTTDSYYNSLQMPMLTLIGSAVLGHGVASVPPHRRWLPIFISCLLIGWHAQLQGRALLRDEYVAYPLRNQVELVRMAARFVQQYTKPDDPLLSFNTHLALEAGLTVPAGYEMAIFAYRPTWSDAEVARYHVINNARLLHDLSQANQVVAMTEFDLEQIYGERTAVRSILQEKYRWFATFPGFGPYGDALHIYAPPQFGRPLPQRPQQADLTAGIRMLGYDIQQSAPNGKPTLSLALYWQTAAPISTSYTVFAQLLDQSGALAVGWDNPPCRATCPTTTWQPGEWVRDEYQLDLSALPSGEYTIQVGMYDPATQQRLAVTASNGQPLGDRILLGAIRFEP